MRSALVKLHGRPAGQLMEMDFNKKYQFRYEEGYAGSPVSLTLPVRKEPYLFDSFPRCFEGLLPEGIMLDRLLMTAKLDKNDYLGQLLVVGADLPGALELYPLDGDE